MIKDSKKKGEFMETTNDVYRTKVYVFLKPNTDYKKLNVVAYEDYAPYANHLGILDQKSRLYDLIDQKEYDLSELLSMGYRDIIGARKYVTSRESGMKNTYIVYFLERCTAIHFAVYKENTYMGRFAGYTRLDEQSDGYFIREPVELFESLGYTRKESLEPDTMYVFNNGSGYYGFDRAIYHGEVLTNLSTYELLKTFKFYDIDCSVEPLGSEVNVLKLVIGAGKESSEGSGKTKVQLAPWLFGYSGQPVASGGNVVTYSSTDRQQLKNIQGVLDIDWYSYENQSGPNIYTSPYLTGRDFNDKKYGEGELIDENERYWVTLGPKVLIPGYPDNGKLLTDEFGKLGLIGCRVDVILRNTKATNDEEKYVYIECVWSGNIKAHTYDNGVYQTGHPYPQSDSAKTEPYKVDYVDGSIIEFTGMEPSTNGTMSNYVVEKLIVY